MKYRELIDKMTLEEKAGLTSGMDFWHTKPIPRLGIPSMLLSDGPHGLRKQEWQSDHLGMHKSVPATCFPTAASLANSWDTDMIERARPGTRPRGCQRGHKRAFRPRLQHQAQPPVRPQL